jgi:hypothetical protein
MSLAGLKTKIGTVSTMKKSAFAAAICLSLLLAACGGGGASSAGGDMSANLPMGVPLMEGATVAMNNNGQGGPGLQNATASLTSTQSADDVFEYYVDAMENAGFDNGRENTVDDIQVYSAMKGSARGMVTVRPMNGKTAVMLVVATD